MCSIATHSSSIEPLYFFIHIKQKPMKTKVFFLAVLAISLFGCEEEDLIPELTELRFCESLNSDNLCSSNVNAFDFGITGLFASVKANSEPGKSVTFKWYYEGGLFGEVDVLLNEGDKQKYRASASIDSQSELPRGDYELEVILEDGNSISRGFAVE